MSLSIAFSLFVDVFICGGYNGELILDDLWKINLQTFQWTKLPAVMPEPAYFHCAAVTPVCASHTHTHILFWIGNQGIYMLLDAYTFEWLQCSWSDPYQRFDMSILLRNWIRRWLFNRRRALVYLRSLITL